MSRTQRPKTTYAILGCAGMACLLTACNAEVREFSAEPRQICPGVQVELHWSVGGSGSVKVTPPNAGLPDGPVDNKGHATIAPTTTTQVALHVTHTLGNPTTRTQQIEVKTVKDKAETLTASVGDATASPGCSGGKVWATVHAQHFAPDVKVATVVAHQGDNRTYDVPHASVRATVAPGEVATAFAGTPAAGNARQHDAQQYASQVTASAAAPAQRSKRRS